MEIFAIIHEFEDTQCLIDSSVQTDESSFNIIIKFWCILSNGFISFTLGYENNELSFNEAWENLKLKENARQYIANFHKQFS